MERNGCPVTSTVPNVPNAVESPKPPHVTNFETTSSPKTERESPEPNCAICLGKTENKSFTDSCLHQFCFSCLLEWSKVKAECPLCKQSFKSIIHNVRSNEDYDEYHLRPADPRYWTEDASVVRFRYSTTLTPERQRERFFENIVRPYFLGTDAIPARRLNNRRRPRPSTSEFRTQVYRENLWVNPLPDVTGRYRECSPEFYRVNPAQVHRLVPWLNRELNVLPIPSQHVMFVLELILSMVTRYSINSVEFQTRITPHIGAHTTHFLHEFYAFARSPYDMIGFDQSADYHSRQSAYALEVQAIESDSDSDVIVLSPDPSTSQSLPNEHAHTGALEAQPLNLSAGSSRVRPRHSPEPGPSGLGNPEDFILMITRELQNPSIFMDREHGIRISTPPENSEPQPHVVDSDSDDCVIVGYVKPRHERTPEIITLPSDAESEPEDRNSVDELDFLLSSSSSSSTEDPSDSDFVPHQRNRKKTTPKRKKVSRREPSSSDESSSTEGRRRCVPSSDTCSSEEDTRRRKKPKAKGKRKRAVATSHDSADDNRSEKACTSKTRKSRREVWRIVRKKEPETDHDYSLDCYDPPYTEDELVSFSTDTRPKLRSIVITKSSAAGTSSQREHSYSSVASSSRSSSHYHESKRHKHKTHKKISKKRKERRRSESSSSPVRSSRAKKCRSKRTYRDTDSSS